MVTIKSVWDMDDETFKKHMNARHVVADGLSGFGDHVDSTLNLSRSFHDAFHRLQPDKYDHHHRPRAGSK